MTNRIRLVLTIIVFSLTGCISQPPTISPKRYTDMTVPVKWTKHAAVTLSHSTDIRLLIDKNGNRVKRKDIRWYRINDRNLDGLAKIALYWSKTFEKPLQIQAEAYYPDGSTWTLSSRQIESAKDPYSNSVSETFRIPGYDDGVILRIVTEREYIQPEFYGTFVLAGNYPTLERTITLHLPEDSNISYGLTAAKDLNIETRKSQTENYTTYTITTSDLEPFKDKWKTNYPEEYYAALHVSFPPEGNSSYTWEELGDHYLSLSESAFEISDSIQQLSVTISLEENEDPVPVLFNEVVSRLRYHGDWNGKFAFFPREAKVILENGYGDCKELATILRTLLSSKERETYLVLLSTWNNFQAIEEYPNLDNFNHAILAVPYGDDNYLFLDPTHSWADSETSYYASIGRKAFVIRPEASHLTKIRPRPDFKNNVKTFSTIRKDNESDKWRIEGTIDLTGYTALRFYEKFHYDETPDDQKFMRSFLRRYLDIPAVEVSSQKLSPNHVSLRYTSPFQNQYLQLGKGGFTLSLPFLHKTYINDRFTERLGTTHRLPFEQIDQWQLPFQPDSYQLNDFSSKIGSGSWEIDGSLLSRKYVQDEILIEGANKDYTTWYQESGSFINSRVWR